MTESATTARDANNAAPTLASMLSETDGLSKREFVERYPHPTLLVEPAASKDGGTRAFNTLHVQQNEPQEEERGVAPEEVVLFPVHKEGVGAANLVTIGRTRSCDIWLDSPSISKLHAYFSRDPVSGEYHLADAGSTNGTRIGKRKLAAKRPHKLKGGEIIHFADRFRGIYLPPKMLFELLRKMRA